MGSPEHGSPKRTAMSHGGRSVILKRSVRFLDTYENSVPEKSGTDQFPAKSNTEVIQFRFFRFGFGIY
jgi:hypothetical protein